MRVASRTAGVIVDEVDTCYRALSSIVNLMITEQRHTERSTYRFVRDTDKETETLQNDGRGLPVNYTGMTWSAFRPSDDACLFGYNIPNNMFAVVVLGHIRRIASEIYKDERLAERAEKAKDALAPTIEDVRSQVREAQANAVDLKKSSRKASKQARAQAHEQLMLAAAALAEAEDAAKHDAKSVKKASKKASKQAKDRTEHRKPRNGDVGRYAPPHSSPRDEAQMKRPFRKRRRSFR